MKKSTILLSILILISLCVNSQTLKVFEEWTTSNGTQNMFLETFTETDASRNVYVSGATVNSSGDYDILLTKYDSRGTLLWTEQYAGAGNGDDAAAAICFGDSGNVYLTGTVYTSANNQNDCVVLKYDQYGNLMWARTYNGNANGPDFGTDICIDASNNVYIGGSSTRTGTYYDFLVLKYDRGGVYQWVSFYDNLHFFEIANKIELNGSSVVVAGGTQVNATKWEYAVANFSASTGSFTGVKTTASTGTGIDQINDLCIDGSGNLYVTGGVVNANTGYDYQTIKLNDSLDVQWTATYNNTDSLDDVARSVQVDANGNVYITGYSLTQDEDTNIVTIKYNSAGTQQWVQEFNDDDDGCDKGEALVVDGSGNIFVAASYFNGSNSDYLTLKYNEDGDQLWLMTYNGLYNLNDEAKDICLDNEGDIIVVGQSCIGDDYLYITVKYSEIDVIIPPDDEDVSSIFNYTENRGQLVDTGQNQVLDIKYYMNDLQPSHYFWDNKLSYVLTDSISFDSLGRIGLQNYYRIDMEFIEASTDLKVRAFDKMSYHTNYYLKHIPNGRSLLKNFSKLLYYNLFDNIDLLFSSNNRGPKLYYIIKPGGSPTDIHYTFSGADSIKIGNDDELILYTSVGKIIYPQAKAYQIDSNNDTINLAWQPEYDLSGSHLYFTTGTYNNSLPLVIEMNNGTATAVGAKSDNLEWCTYVGGSKRDQVRDICVDSKNNVYITGDSYSEDFPNYIGGATGHIGDTDAFVYQIDENTNVIFETYYGGWSCEVSNCISIDPYGRKIYIAGLTNSLIIPFLQPTSLPNAYQDVTNYSNNGINEVEMFFARFDQRYGTLDWSTFYGSSDPPNSMLNSYEEALEMDIYFKYTPFIGYEMENLYIVGTANVNTTLINPTYTSGDGIILKFNQSLEPVWVSRFPSDWINDIVVDQTNNNFYITGMVSEGFGAMMPIEHPDISYPGTSTHFGNHDAFVAAFSSNTSLGAYLSEFIGGSSWDNGKSIDIDNSSVIIGGGTQSNDFLTKDEIQGVYGGNTDAFITKIDRTGLNLGKIIWSSYFGADGVEGDILGNDLNVQIDQNSNIVLFGKTNSGTINNTSTIPFPTSNPSDVLNNTDKFGISADPASWDTYIAYFNSDLEYLWATYFGSNSSDESNACAIGSNSSGERLLYVGGLTSYSELYAGTTYVALPTIADPSANPTIQLFQPNFTPTTNIYNPTLQNNDGFLARFVLPDVVLINIHEESLNRPILNLYPNPTNTFVNIVNENLINESIRIYNSLGLEIKLPIITKSNKQKILDVSDLKSGCYYVLVQDINGKLYSGEFIKIE